MTLSATRAIRAAGLATSILASPLAAAAQDGGSPGLLDRMFNRDAGQPAAVAQLSDSDLVVRLDRLENQIRQLTGTIEQLQYRNQQLEQSVKRMQDDTEYRFQELSGKGGMRAAPPPVRSQAPPPTLAPGRRSDAAEPPEGAAAVAAGPAMAAASRGRRADVFDPTENPNAPGAPRTLGSLSSGGPEPIGRTSAAVVESPMVSPPGRAAGAPLDLGRMAGQAAADPTLTPAVAGQSLPPPPPRNPSATGAPVAMVEPPSATPKDEYDLGYGYILRKDYGLAEQAFRHFLHHYPSDRLVADANYWLGESLFQQQRYRDAAESFLAVTTKYETAGKAPDSLLRLGQSLAALGEKEAACAALGEVGRKYPRASVSIKQGVDREQKRVRC